jgi:hypothetical protein
MEPGKGTTHLGARSEQTAFGISNCQSQIAELKSEIWNLKFRAQRGIDKTLLSATGEARSSVTRV